MEHLVTKLLEEKPHIHTHSHTRTEKCKSGVKINLLYKATVACLKFEQQDDLQHMKYAADRGSTVVALKKL